MNSQLSDSDSSKEIAEVVGDAFKEITQIQIIGGNSKPLEARPMSGKPISVLEHRGVTEYSPSELVITARAGTPLADIENQLAESGQMLPFEPPHLDANSDGYATIGGTISCGLSGPRRPFAGSARDVMLGARIINGRGEVLKFGGQVMKNVAGYDVSRVMVGAQGTLGILLDVSLKVLPVPERELTLCMEMDAEEAILTMNKIAGKPVPLSAACFVPHTQEVQKKNNGQLWLRLSGVESAIKAASEKLGGEQVNNGQQFWFNLRERNLEFFNQKDSLWRLSLPPATPDSIFPGSSLIDWGGAQRWLQTDVPDDDIRSTVSEIGGHATLYNSQGAFLPPLTPELSAIHQRVKASFDPKNILNSGRLYEWL